MLHFNHAMIYSRDIQKSLGFYRDLLGFEVLEEFRGGPRLVYARLKASGSSSTIALHLTQDGLQTGGIRLYFETPDLAGLCKELEAKGAVFTKPAALMPWGWMHAYLDDPDGHEVSLYTAGEKRLAKS